MVRLTSLARRIYLNMVQLRCKLNSVQLSDPSVGEQIPRFVNGLDGRSTMSTTALYQSATAVLAVFFLGYGMDMKPRLGARNFVAWPWQVLLKLSAGLLVTGFAWLALSMRPPGLIDWLALIF